MTAPLPNDDPPVSFYYTVTIDGSNGASDATFAEVSGLEAERGAGEVNEGGENRYVHRLPDRARFGNLTFKRGVLPGDSALAMWCRGVVEDNFSASIQPKDLTVALRDPGGAALMTWHFTHAWPVKWSMAALASDNNEMAVETLELAYASFTRTSRL